MFEIPSEIVAMLPAIVTIAALIIHCLLSQRKKIKLAEKMHQFEEKA
jgi:hypothetical protein